MTGPTEHLPNEDAPTAELPVVDDDPTAVLPLPKARSGFWRELSGSLALGLCALAAVVLGLQILSWSNGMPGPGVPVVIGHVVAAAAAVVLQQSADQRQGWLAAVPVLAVTAVTSATAWFFWWS